MAIAPVTETLRLRSALQGTSAASIRVPLDAAKIEPGSDGPVDGYWLDMARDGTRRFIPSSNVIERVSYPAPVEPPKPAAEADPPKPKRGRPPKAAEPAPMSDEEREILAMADPQG